MPKGRKPGPPQPEPEPDELRHTGASEEQRQLAVGLARLRRTHGWTHQQLANTSGVNHATIAGIEAGVRDASFKTLVRLRAALGSPDWPDLLGP